MPDLFADTAGADGVNINTENYSVDPQFSDPVNGNFTIGTDSPAFASGDTTLDLAGSIISDSFAGTDIAFMDGSGHQNLNFELGALQQSTAFGTTVSRASSNLQTFSVMAPSLGVFEVVVGETGHALTGHNPAEISANNESPSDTISGGTQITGNRVSVTFRDDDIGETTTRDPELAALSTGGILVDNKRQFAVEFELEGAIRVNEADTIISTGDRVFIDENTNRNNSETRGTVPVGIAVLIGNTGDRPSFTTIDGTAVVVARTTPRECAKKVPLIGLDYNINTLVCISEQYDRNVINVPYGLGIGWAQGPPALRMRGKTVYKVLNNSPATNYVK
tara:strand:- start:908 stop:1912 length:1005 start_codon:yes stop_codon:yes gene_type:complete